MRKLRLYLDTSVISHLYSKHSASIMFESWFLWFMIIQGNYEIVLSEVVFSEIEGCAQPKQDYLLYFVGKIKYTHIKINDEIREIADEIIRQGILKMRSYKDCLHIGAALYSNCDYLISWNIEDLSNFKTVNGVRKINTLLGHNDIDIVTPETFKIMEEK